MNDLKDVAEFASQKFAPVLPDECQVNPGVYGAELAFWLCSTLARLGVITSYPEYEDWGWYIEYSTNAGAEFALHCGNVGGSRERWQLSLRRFGRRMFGRDKPSYSEAAPLIDAVKRSLEAEVAISDLEWRYSETDAA